MDYVINVFSKILERNEMRILSIITARGGSKKLPNKNILKLKKNHL